MSEVVGQTPPVATPAPVVEVPPVTATPEPEVKPERTFTQAELDAAIEKRLSKERRKRTEIETRLKVTEELALKSKPEPKAEPKAGARPIRDQFESYEDFIRADARWEAKQEVETALKERDTRSQEEKSKADQQQKAEAFKKRTKELAKDLTDFDEVMAEATNAPDSPVSRLLAEPIEECENPAAILYHLAKNPEEAERIANLGAAKQAREIWALESKLKSTPAPKKPSNAPEPIAPVGGKATAGDKEPDAKTNQEGWLKWRERQVRAKKG